MEINLQTSKFFFVLLSLLHLCAVFCVIPLGLPILIKIFLVIFVFLSFIYYLKIYIFLNYKSSIIKIGLRKKEFLLYTKSGHILNGTILGNSFISSFLMVLNFRIENKKMIKAVPLFIDMMPKENWRRLRMKVSVRRESLGSGI